MISIIICTCNRAEYLRSTLEAMSYVQIPDGLTVELIVVDNDSTDSTAEVIKSCKSQHLPIRYIHEAKRGLSRARNRGMAEAQGEILLWTDDDVRPSRNWIEGMCAPILEKKADVVAGGVKMAPHLKRPWMSDIHRIWLASTEHINQQTPEGVVGANMAFSRRVLLKVPAFDTELGAGALGMGEETLFVEQVKQAGYHLASALHIEVEHHFDADRLLKSSFLDRAAKEGKVRGYLFYHWGHNRVRLPRLRLWLCQLQLFLMRLIRRHDCRQSEGIPLWEMNLVARITTFSQYLAERRRPRNYSQFGLVKRVCD